MQHVFQIASLQNYSSLGIRSKLHYNKKPGDKSRASYSEGTGILCTCTTSSQGISFIYCTLFCLFVRYVYLNEVDYLLLDSRESQFLQMHGVVDMAFVVKPWFLCTLIPCCYIVAVFFRSLWCTCKYLKPRKIRDLCNVLGRYLFWYFFFTSLKCVLIFNTFRYCHCVYIWLFYIAHIYNALLVRSFQIMI